MPKDFPDHHDADLILRLYELRREPLLREARKTMGAWYPRTPDEALAVTKPDHPNNAAYRQVSGYWEMVYGMARHGIVHAEFLIENNTEGLFFLSRLERFLDDIRRATNPRVLQNTEWAAKHTDLGQTVIAAYRSRIEQMLAAAPKKG